MDDIDRVKEEKIIKLIKNRQKRKIEEQILVRVRLKQKQLQKIYGAQIQ